MVARRLYSTLILLLVSVAAVRAAEERATLAGVPILDQAPSCPAELVRALQAYPDMAALARDAEAIDTGLQPLVYGEHLPLGPAPATPWAKPLPGGPLKLVFIGQTNNCYDLAEVQRRVDCQVRFIHLPDQYYFAKTYPEAVAGYYSTQALATLEHEADVILADPLVRILSPQVAAAIQRKVQAGCGLVLLPVARWGGGGQFGYWPTTEKMDAWKELFAALVKSAAPARLVSQHAVTSTDGLWDGVPWSLLPAHHLVGLVPAETATVLAKDGELSLAVGGPVGKGRAVLLPWGTYMGCFPLAEDNQPVKIRDYQEYYASAIIRALLWAANRPSPVGLSLVADRQQAGVAGKAQIKLAGAVPDGREAGVAAARLAVPGSVAERRPRSSRRPGHCAGRTAGAGRRRLPAGCDRPRRPGQQPGLGNLGRVGRVAGDAERQSGQGGLPARTSGDDHCAGRAAARHGSGEPCYGRADSRGQLHRDAAGLGRA